MSVEEAQAQLAAAIREWQDALNERATARQVWNAASARCNEADRALFVAYQEVQAAHTPELDLSVQ